MMAVVTFVCSFRVTTYCIYRPVCSGSSRLPGQTKKYYGIVTQQNKTLVAGTGYDLDDKAAQQILPAEEDEGKDQVYSQLCAMLWTKLVKIDLRQHYNSVNPHYWKLTLIRIAQLMAYGLFCRGNYPSGKMRTVDCPEYTADELAAERAISFFNLVGFKTNELNPQLFATKEFDTWTDLFNRVVEFDNTIQRRVVKESPYKQYWFVAQPVKITRPNQVFLPAALAIKTLLGPMHVPWNQNEVPELSSDSESDSGSESDAGSESDSDE